MWVKYLEGARTRSRRFRRGKGVLFCPLPVPPRNPKHAPPPPGFVFSPKWLLCRRRRENNITYVYVFLSGFFSISSVTVRVYSRPRITVASTKTPGYMLPFFWSKNLLPRTTFTRDANIIGGPANDARRRTLVRIPSDRVIVARR